MFQSIRDWWSRLLGRHVCEEFTQWKEMRKSEVSVPVFMSADEVERILNAMGSDPSKYTHRWQERRCTMCGAIQQRKLN